jgi:hypothetical protein
VYSFWSILAGPAASAFSAKLYSMRQNDWSASVRRSFDLASTNEMVSCMSTAGVLSTDPFDTFVIRLSCYKGET